MSGKWMARLRRTSQILSLAVFVAALVWSGGDRLLAFLLAFDPLAALLNALATRALYRGLLWSLAILLPTLFLGRFFCGWLCPLGTMNHFLGRYKTGRQRIATNRYGKWHRVKYYVLAACVAAAIFGGGIGGVLDPISLAVRSLSGALLPTLHYALKDVMLPFRGPMFRQGVLIGILFAAILALNFWTTRFWCRALCPLGALLALLSRWSVFGLEKRASHCTDCSRCALDCQGGDDPAPGATWRKEECHLCFNCVAQCPEAGIAFRFFPEASHTASAPNLKRRLALTSMVGGAASIAALRAGAEGDARLIRPPGAVEEKQFLARCIRCSACIHVCPNHALQPAFTEAGCEGFWTPVLVPRAGYCEANCVRCTAVCPTGAIWEITSREKAWATPSPAKPIRIGTAFYDQGRCLPWSMATECIVCEEWCPTSPKAIYLKPVEVTARTGEVRRVRQPYVDPALCVGCGACEHACPVGDVAAIRVSAIGESRAKARQMLLGAREGFRFPDTAQWRRAGTVREFDAENLWRHVNGDAERYLRAGIERAFTQRYAHAGGAEAVVDVYRMKSVESAKTLFDGESAQGAQAVAIGDAARDFGSMLVFRRGALVVRLTAYQTAPLLELAKALGG